MKKCFAKLLNVIIVVSLSFQSQAISKTSFFNKISHHKSVDNLTSAWLQGITLNQHLLAFNGPVAQIDGELEEGTSKPSTTHPHKTQNDTHHFALKLQVTKQSGIAPKELPLFQTIWLDDVIEASYKDKILGFRFISNKANLQPSLSNPSTKSTHFQGVNSVSPINYFDLPPGIHEFRVTLNNQKESNNEEEFRWTVIIHPPWWQSWWFCSSIAGILILGALGFYLNRRMNKDKPKLTKSPDDLFLPVDHLDSKTLGQKKLEQPTTDQQVLRESKETTQLKEQLHEIVVTQELYKEEDISLTNLAQKMQISERRLSELFNRELHTSFYDYINQCRVNAFKERIKQGGNEHLKLIAIAYESGFRSKATFNRIFKKYTGLTPSQYRKMIEDSLDH